MVKMWKGMIQKYNMSSMNRNLMWSVHSDNGNFTQYLENDWIINIIVLVTAN